MAGEAAASVIRHSFCARCHIIMEQVEEEEEGTGDKI